MYHSHGWRRVGWLDSAPLLRFVDIDWLFSMAEYRTLTWWTERELTVRFKLHLPMFNRRQTYWSVTSSSGTDRTEAVGSETVSYPEWRYRRVINLLLTVFWSDKVRSVVGGCRLAPQTTQSWTSPQGPIKERKQRIAERQTQYKLTEPCGLDWTNTCLDSCSSGDATQQQQH